MAWRCLSVLCISLAMSSNCDLVQRLCSNTKRSGYASCCRSSYLCCSRSPRSSRRCGLSDRSQSADPSSSPGSLRRSGEWPPTSWRSAAWMNSLSPRSSSESVTCTGLSVLAIWGRSPVATKPNVPRDSRSHLSGFDAGACPVTAPANTLGTRFTGICEPRVVPIRSPPGRVRTSTLPWW